jgi:hypothetical protein
MKLALLLASLAALLCLSATASAADHARAAYQDSSKINKYSRREMLARAPNLTPVRWNYPVPYQFSGNSFAAEHSYSTESVYNQPGYRPASSYSSYSAINTGGFGGRAYRYQTGYAPYYGGYADPYLYGGYYGGSTVIYAPRGGHFRGSFGSGSVRFSGGRMGRSSR